MGGGEGMSEGELLNVNIRSSNGSKFLVKTSVESTVRELKCLIAQNCDVPAEQQRLIYKGRILKDDQTLSSYGLQADHTVHMVRIFIPSPTTTSNVTANEGNSASSVPAPHAREPVAPSGISLFPGLDFSAFDGLPDFEQMQQLQSQNPNLMRDIMNMPALQSFMNNPEIMRSLVMNNPRLREIIDRNPELAHILNDPSILRQTMEAARSPEIMREMMRNTDRAMSNLESSPEGFNMLRRMYENVQEPFLNATTMGGSGAAAGTNPFASPLGGHSGPQDGGGSDSSATGPENDTGATTPNSNPLPNPWSSNGIPRSNSATTTNSTDNTRRRSNTGSQPVVLPRLDANGIPEMSSVTQFFQNPAVAQVMQNLLSNVEYIDQFLSSNPQLGNFLTLNPQLRQIMQNPELLRELISPATMQQVLAFQQQLARLRQPPSTQGGDLTDQNGSTRNIPSLDALMNLFGGLGAGSLTPNDPNVPPEELYATQLTQLQEMGFVDTQENIIALRATSGNIHAAVERLLGNPGR